MKRAKEKSVKFNRSNGASYTSNDKLFYALLIALPILQLIVFYIIVNFRSFLMSFQVYNGSTSTFEWTGTQTGSNGEIITKSGLQINFEWLTNLMQGNDFWMYLKNSILVFCFATLAGLFLAILFSYYLYKRRLGHNFFKFMLFMPALLPVIFLSTLYKKFIGEGLPSFLNIVFHSTGMNNVFTTYCLYGNNANNDLAIVITLFSIWISFGTQVLVYTGAMDQISSEVIESAKLDGASSSREFFSIILPQIIPAMSTFIIGGVAGIFSNRNNIASFIGFTSNTCGTFGYYLYSLIAVDVSAKDMWTKASFLGLILSIIGLGLNFIVRKILKKYTD